MHFVKSALLATLAAPLALLAAGDFGFPHPSGSGIDPLPPAIIPTRAPFPNMTAPDPAGDPTTSTVSFSTVVTTVDDKTQTIIYSIPCPPTTTSAPDGPLATGSLSTVVSTIGGETETVISTVSCHRCSSTTSTTSLTMIPVTTLFGDGGDGPVPNIPTSPGIVTNISSPAAAVTLSPASTGSSLSSVLPLAVSPSDGPSFVRSSPGTLAPFVNSTIAPTPTSTFDIVNSVAASISPTTSPSATAIGQVAPLISSAIIASPGSTMTISDSVSSPLGAVMSASGDATIPLRSHTVSAPFSALTSFVPVSLIPTTIPVTIAPVLASTDGTPSSIDAAPDSAVPSSTPAGGSADVVASGSPITILSEVSIVTSIVGGTLSILSESIASLTSITLSLPPHTSTGGTSSSIDVASVSTVPSSASAGGSADVVVSGIPITILSEVSVVTSIAGGTLSVISESIQSLTSITLSAPDVSSSPASPTPSTTVAAAAIGSSSPTSLVSAPSGASPETFSPGPSFGSSIGTLTRAPSGGLEPDAGNGNATLPSSTTMPEFEGSTTKVTVSLGAGALGLLFFCFFIL